MPSRPRVLVAGGGPAAVESLLALRTLTGNRTELSLISPEPELVVRAYEVLAPFHERGEHRYPLTRIAEDVGCQLIRDALASVDPVQRTVALRSGSQTSYDALVIAVGARSLGTVEGAIAFRGARDASRVKELLIESQTGRHRTVAFVVPAGSTWPLPLYELALNSSAWLRERAVMGVPLLIVSPEPAPLAAFGTRVTDEVAAMLRMHGITFVSGHAFRHEADRLLLAGGRGVDAQLAIALPRLGGPAIHGLPQDRDGFLPVDADGRVAGVERVFAAGDATDAPIKHGGLATQQADVVADAVWAELRSVAPPGRPAPVLQAVLYGGHEKRYLRAELGVHLEKTSEASESPLWPESSKVLGRYLAAYLDTLDEARVAR